jgi:Pilus formation protein N terminal region
VRRLTSTLAVVFATASSAFFASIPSVRAQAPPAQSSPTPQAPPTAPPAPPAPETPAGTPAAAPIAPSATPQPAAGQTAPPPLPEQPTPVPTPTPTPAPIIVEPPSAGVTPGGSQTLRLEYVYGNVTFTVANPAIADATVDQTARTLTIVGKTLGTTTITVRDDRGTTRDVAVRVAYPAGSIADSVQLRVTGRPASALFIRAQALAAAIKQVSLRPGATIVANQDEIQNASALQEDDVTTIDVPIIVQGDAYFTVQGVTHVRVENFALPSVSPRSLLVSDFPETLKANGILFEADVVAKQAERFLYFHFDPAGQPDRRIVLKAQNTSSQPALVQFISGAAGPQPNEMEVGHVSTQRFLVRLAQNEGTVVSIPAQSTVSLMDQVLPTHDVVSGLMQIQEISGAPLHLTLVAQDATDPVEGPIPASALLVGDEPHARGVYPIPEFRFDYSYEADGPDLEIPIGQIPLPNLVKGQTLAGDYGVLQDVSIRMVNNDRHNARDIAIYANPRGGRATGTFVIDRVLVQAHAMEPFGHYKLRQYTIPPGSFVRTEIVTMPEGGSSYPLRLIVAPDDGSAAPGTEDSPVY